MGEPQAAATLRLLTLTLIGLLIALVVSWTLSAGLSAGRAVLALVLILPLCAPLRGLVRRERRTYAWATLCVIPYFVMGLTESVANPHGRLWSGACLALALLLFVALIAYLRATRPR
ncbi:MAG TPA: DUF2069 domain-containing protein [Povalibacter sp.]|uniref:DUF2069 domain-containing protein n=1 Tax=Povalibacter sp. TaxID=1962978 RepID=UPI002C5F02AD|nr:DUF2069 domain-containing protein [Povalibacter sp.]HMN43466.1 DUF2069 domain-containing protein [Povalibacter sp.]